MLTLEEYDKIPIGTIFREGISTNSPSGVYMTTSDTGRLLRWVAIKKFEGWIMYIHWSLSNSEYISRHGDSLSNKDIVKRLIPCTDEVYDLYYS